jgi:hypothetical protein
LYVIQIEDAEDVKELLGLVQDWAENLESDDTDETDQLIGELIDHVSNAISKVEDLDERQVGWTESRKTECINIGGGDT